MEDTRIARIENKIDRILETLASTATEVKNHKERADKLDAKFDSEIKPLREHVEGAKGAKALLSIIAIVAGVMGGVAEALMAGRGGH
jgi:uncharacterized protein YaaN involved in tellurite resistance